MTFQYLLKKAGVVMLMLAMPAFLCSPSEAQIKVFERTQETDISGIGLYRSSEKRTKISLNGTWNASFNEGKSFQQFSVPLAYDFREKAIFRKSFEIPADLLANCSFIFVAEGIEYESEVKINGNFVATHTGGQTPVVTPVNEGIVANSNEIVVTVFSKLDHDQTLPLSNQINYGDIKGGINKDIYLLAVPKLHVTKSVIRYTVDNVLSVKLNNQISISSSNLSSMPGSDDSAFSVQTVIIRKSSGAEAAMSERKIFKIGENNSVKLENSLSIPDPVLWSPAEPALYVVRTLIYSGDVLIDEMAFETGFTNISFSGGQLFVSGKPMKIMGINYFEDQPKGSTALSYDLVFKDMTQIRNLGFNTVRVPGKSAHPYLVEACNNLGLFLMQEIPFNESSSHYLEDEKYMRLVYNSLNDIIHRDINSPCILAWGLGNDFDVSGEAAANYVKIAAGIVDSLNRRLKYYTSRTYNEDICSEFVDFTGINFYGRKYDEVRNTVNEITNRQRAYVNRKNPYIFAARFGIRIDNGNANGFSDIHSQEAQMKFMNEAFPKLLQSTMGGFLSSFADWHSFNPLNYPLSDDPYLVTDGIHTFAREEKRSAGFAKRILYNEDLPRIQEGNHFPDFPYVFIVTGIAVMIILLYFLNHDKKLRSGMLRCLYKPTYFYSLVKDQMIVSTGYNLLIAFSIATGLALMFSSVLYFLKESNSLDMILAKIFTNGSTKIVIGEITGNKYYLLASLIVINFLLIVFTSFLLYFISFYTKGKSFFKNIFTVCVWSTLPMIIFLPFGTVLYKLAEGNSGFISLALWIFFILYLLYLNRIILGARSLFDIRTGKVYFYGILIIAVFFGAVYLYTWLFTGVTETVDLIEHLKAH